VKLAALRLLTSVKFGQVAQSVEQRPEKPCVASSILALSTGKGGKEAEPSFTFFSVSPGSLSAISLVESWPCPQKKKPCSRQGFLFRVSLGWVEGSA
jgi:hypothetical protein